MDICGGRIRPRGRQTAHYFAPSGPAWASLCAAGHRTNRVGRMTRDMPEGKACAECRRLAKQRRPA